MTVLCLIIAAKLIGDAISSSNRSDTVNGGPGLTQFG
jgi:hypothetical protein